MQNLTVEQAVAVVGTVALRGFSKQRRSNWKHDGVPWDVIGPIILRNYEAAREAHLAGTAQGLKEVFSFDSTAPEGSMADPTFLEAWQLVGNLWKLRDSALDTERELWPAFIIVLRGMSGAIAAPRVSPRRKRADKPANG